MTLVYKFFLIVFASSTLACATHDAAFLIQHVKKCIEQAEQKKSKITPDILNIKGLSSPKVRHLLNNICSLPNGRYLEIGVWNGSTFISALYRNFNLQEAIAIDNWSEFAGSHKNFMAHTNIYIPNHPFKLHDKDAFTIDLTDFCKGKINIYFYDGDHKAESHRQAFTYFNTIFDDVFIAIIDDWNWDCVKAGTKEAFSQLNYQILYEQELPALVNMDTENWWNGLYVAVIYKKS